MQTVCGPAPERTLGRRCPSMFPFFRTACFGPLGWCWVQPSKHVTYVVSSARKEAFTVSQTTMQDVQREESFLWVGFTLNSTITAFSLPGKGRGETMWWKRAQGLRWGQRTALPWYTMQGNCWGTCVPLHPHFLHWPRCLQSHFLHLFSISFPSCCCAAICFLSCLCSHRSQTSVAHWYSSAQHQLPFIPCRVCWNWLLANVGQLVDSSLRLLFQPCCYQTCHINSIHCVKEQDSYFPLSI